MFPFVSDTFDDGNDVVSGCETYQILVGICIIVQPLTRINALLAVDITT